MADQQIDELPQDIREQLPEHAQQIFFTASMLLKKTV